jgi:hypothetical protein
MKNLIEKIFTEGVHRYIEKLFSLWNENPDVEKCINQLFFSSKENIKNILQNATINSFSDYSHESLKKMELISANDVSTHFVPLLNPLNISEYDIFDYRVFENIEDALKFKQKSYFLIKKSYYNLLDKKLLSTYSDYEKVNDGLYRKTFFENFFIELDFVTSRDLIDDSLNSFTFPYININLNWEKYMLASDIRDFIFLRAKSFIIFYYWSHVFEINEIGRMAIVREKEDEPLISEYYGRFRVSNCGEVIKICNSVVSTLLNLHTIHFRLFEKWLIDEVRFVLNKK